MKDMHEIFTRFKQEFPEVYAKYEALGQEIHEHAGPLDEKSRWRPAIINAPWRPISKRPGMPALPMMKSSMPCCC